MNLKEQAAEIAKKYEHLPMRDKIGIIAQAFGCTSGKIETFPCHGKWRGTSDIHIKFDSGVSLLVGNNLTPKAKTVKVQREYVDAVLLQYNPEIVAIAKETALVALREREVKDNEIAAKMGLKPYTVLNVEFNDGAHGKSVGWIGWYYATLAVGGKIHAHMDTGLNHAIAHGTVREAPAQKYYIAGTFNEAEVDYVFNNVGFSSTSTLYSFPIPDEVMKRATMALAERCDTQPHKPSIKAQLAARPVPGEKPAAMTKDREVR